MRHLNNEGKSKCQGRNARYVFNEISAGSRFHATSSGGSRMSTEDASIHAVNWAFVLVETGMAMTVLKAPSVSRLAFRSLLISCRACLTRRAFNY